MRREEKAFLIGVCLGDGCLRPNGGNVASLSLKHSIKQEEYFLWKVERIRKILGGSPNKIVYFNNNSYPGVRWEKSHRYFRVIRKWLYKDGVKTITPFILSKLTPEAIAVWWMDDGSMYKKRNPKTKKVKAIEGVLSTYTSKEENIIIQQYFKEKWGINFALVKSKNSYRLRLNTNECRKLAKLIEPYIHPSMAYKIDVNMK